MLFYTPIYLFLFLPVILYFYYNFGSITNIRKTFLIFFSLIFYSYWEIKFLPIIIFSIIINYFFYILIAKSNLNKKLVLWVGIFLNLIILILFKYTNFVIDNYNYLFQSNIENLNITFPLAISFFTFQSIIFLVNCYDKDVIDVKHIKELQNICPNAKIMLVDGEYFSWYGSRLQNASTYFMNLINEIT